MPPRATSNTAKSTRGFCSTMRAERGPEASAATTSRSSMRMPSVVVSPTWRPIPLKMWAIIRAVVVLPLVPVTATIGMRLGVPGGKRRSTTGLATYCGSPMVGWVCMRKPGAALTSTIHPPTSRTGSAMSGVMKSIPATSRPTTLAASSAISTLSGWASSVRSLEMPPVDMLPVRVSLTVAPFGGTSSSSNPWARTSSTASSSTRMRVRTFSWPTPLRGSALVSSTSWATVMVAVAGDVGRHPLGDRDHLPADDQHPIVVAVDMALDHHPAAARLGLGRGERGGDLLVGAQVELHAAAVVAVQRLDHHRQAGLGQQPVGLHLVAGQVDRQQAGPGGHGGADALLVDPLAELDQRELVQPQPGDVAGGRLVDDRLGGGPERGPLGLQDEALQLGIEAEAGLRLDEVVDQPHGQAAGSDPDTLVTVPVDHVVPAALAGAAGLAAALLATGLPLKLEGDVLGDVAQPDTLPEPLDEAAAATHPAGVFDQARQQPQQLVGEAGQGVGGEVLQRAEVHQQVDGPVEGPVVGAAVHAGLEDAQVRRRRRLHCDASCSSSPPARRRGRGPARPRRPATGIDCSRGSSTRAPRSKR